MKLLESNTESVTFSLTNEAPFDSNCDAGYVDTVSGPLIGETSLPLQAKKALRTLPRSLLMLPSVATIYRFEITDAARGRPLIYIGKTSSMRRRVADYVEMTRRLLGLYHRHPMWTDRNRFLFVHYELADALLTKRAVTLWYSPQRPDIPNQELARLEQLAIAHAVVCYQESGDYNFKVLNAMGCFDKTSQAATQAWQDVQKHL